MNHVLLSSCPNPFSLNDHIESNCLTSSSYPVLAPPTVTLLERASLMPFMRRSSRRVTVPRVDTASGIDNRLNDFINFFEKKARPEE